MASLDAVILPDAHLYFNLFYLEMPERKDARTSEKHYKVQPLACLFKVQLLEADESFMSRTIR
jgi:hypothetical protein